MFRNVIVRRPSRSLVNGITSSPELGAPDYDLALKQHDQYIEVMQKCGARVTVLPAMEEYPDSCFVEDVAVVTPHCAVITNPGAASRNGEKAHIVKALKAFYPENRIHNIERGTLEGGDVMMVGNGFYVGLSGRTNEEGIAQFAAILERYGMTCTAVPVQTVLHLKTGVVYLENHNMLANAEFFGHPAFAEYHREAVPPQENYAANCLWVNDKVIVPAGYPIVTARVRALGYETMEVEMSEYRKIDGGLSCLSLRF
jgi:dimethylargininase